MTLKWKHQNRLLYSVYAKSFWINITSRTIYNFIAALKSPVLECRNSELPGTALHVADWPLDFKGLKTSGERFLSPNPVSLHNSISYNGRHERNLYPNKTNMVQRKESRRSKCNEFRLPGTVSRVTAWPLDFKGLKTSGKRFSSGQALNCYLYKPRNKIICPLGKSLAAQNTRKTPTENRSGFAYRVPFCM